ncbi:hypothetical protein, partial [Mycobacterium tuberculosis]|uniref:hypothetical protein n=3 Tax=Mycobacterium tuberculosis TaxID=1773 RepID=UPI000B032640
HSHAVAPANRDTGNGWRVAVVGARLRSSDGMKNFRKTGNGWYRKSVFFARQLRVNDDRAVARSSLVYGRVFDHLPQHLRSAERDQP